jgi:MauM/NapG family ferredoxin protein
VTGGPSVAKRARTIVWIRRIVQTVALVLFLILLTANRPANIAAPTAPVSFFFDLNPLVMISTWLATHTFEGLSLLAVLTLLVTVVFGRVFCGWFCPLGTLNNIMGSLRQFFRRITRQQEGFSRWQRAKYFVLIAMLLMSAAGAQWMGVLDPFSLLYRSVSLTVMPVLDIAMSTTANAIYLADPSVGALHLRDLSEPVYRWWQEAVTATEVRVFSGSGTVFLLFVAVLVLNLVRNRFWCRYICPLGAMLGAFSVRPFLRLVNDAEACNSCAHCTKACPAAAQPELPGQWLATECFGCWNCVDTCQNQAIDFKWTLPMQRTSTGSMDLGRRRVLTSLAAGGGGLAMLSMTPQTQGLTNNPKLIRPPGSRAEQDFLDRCVRCGLCMQTCPSGGLQPTWGEAGLEGLWSPMLVPAIGWCEFECYACGQVCPTEAIQPLELEVKKKAKIGLAVIDTTRCLPFAYGRECIVCEEHCPIPDKAITFIMKEAEQRDGSVLTLKFPRVDPDRCIGCGICETKCPFQDLAAIRIVSAGEDRNPDNQPMLSGGGDSYSY